MPYISFLGSRKHKLNYLRFLSSTTMTSLGISKPDFVSPLFNWDGQEKILFICPCSTIGITCTYCFFTVASGQAVVKRGEEL